VARSPTPRSLKLLLAAALWPLAAAAAPPPATAASGAEDPRSYVEFVQEFAGHCVARGGVQILVRSRHPSRTLKVWFDRFHGGSGTGDRSRSELKPGAEPDPLGCSKNNDAPQEWRIVRAEFVD
jgi:hypothetical protein